MAEIKGIQFTPVAAEAPGADALRLARDRNGALLMVSKTTPTPPLGAKTVFSALATASHGIPWNEVGAVHEMVPAQPAWDVAIATNGRPEIVYERHGGAINALILRDASGATRPVSAEYPLDSFSAPRFARPSGTAPEWLTAVLDHRRCVAFPVAGGSYGILGECAEGLLVKTGSGFVFIYKTNVPGPVRGNLLSPGHIHVAALDAHLRPVGKSSQLFSGTVFEFDADIIQDRLTIVGTTPKGVVIASGPAKGQATTLTSLELQVPIVLTSPAIIARSSGKAFLAALNGQQVLTAEIDFP